MKVKEAIRLLLELDGELDLFSDKCYEDGYHEVEDVSVISLPRDLRQVAYIGPSHD